MNWVSFLYGAVIVMILAKYAAYMSDKGNIVDECPFCHKISTIHYETMYECSECHKRSTDDELKEQARCNEDAIEQEREREFQRIHKQIEKEEYQRKIEELKKYYHQ